MDLSLIMLRGNLFPQYGSLGLGHLDQAFISHVTRLEVHGKELIAVDVYAVFKQVIALKLPPTELIGLDGI